MTRRTEQLNSVIHRAAQSVISKGFGDPRLDGCLLTITHVKVTDDARTAVLSVSVMPAKYERRAMAGLKAATKHVRRRSAELVNVHRMPEFIFKTDRGLKREAEVLTALEEVRQEWNTREESPADSQPSTPPNVDSQEIDP